MTDTNRPTPAQTGDAASGGPETRPAGPEPAAPRDPTAERTANAATDVESPGGGAGADPDGLDQSVGREDAGQGDARTRDGAI
ncbi:MAG: hypothetical protein U1E18_29170 [Brevundimonas sp.]|uniref:hypothetical protein n=1 Tax=Brevundimonas sp. TaxID=1871086 RepID=UPI002ABC5810|nr:hypothetical protein [Brevundimonas sp.]MDZ4113644.1 hypothetical protein [Brevundimonas sp.]